VADGKRAFLKTGLACAEACRQIKNHDGARNGIYPESVGINQPHSPRRKTLKRSTVPMAADGTVVRATEQVYASHGARLPVAHKARGQPR
jgi:hypothetical protein